MQESNLLTKHSYIGPPIDEHTQFMIQPSHGFIKDLTGHTTPTVGGNLSIDNTNTLFGQPTMKFPAGGNASVTIPNPAFVIPGVSDFTFDTYINVADVVFNPADSSKHWPLFLWGTWAVAGEPYNMALDYYEDSYSVQPSLQFTYKDASTAKTLLYPSGHIVRNAWHHIALQRRSAVLRFYIDGQPSADIAFPDNLAVTTARDWLIGNLKGGSGGSVNWWAVGNMAYFRMSNIARYTTAFNPFVL
jgi:hypothetical protein